MLLSEHGLRHAVHIAWCYVVGAEVGMDVVGAEVGAEVGLGVVSSKVGAEVELGVVPSTLFTLQNTCATMTIFDTIQKVPARAISYLLMSRKRPELERQRTT